MRIGVDGTLRWTFVSGVDGSGNALWWFVETTTNDVDADADVLCYLVQREFRLVVLVVHQVNETLFSFNRINPELSYRHRWKLEFVNSRSRFVSFVMVYEGDRVCESNMIRISTDDPVGAYPYS